MNDTVVNCGPTGEMTDDYIGPRVGGFIPVISDWAGLPVMSRE